MPTYVYKFVDSGETIEVRQGFHEDALTEIAHPDSGDMMPVKKVFTPVGVTFKGSGFFKTDNRGKKSSTSSSSTDSSSGSKSDSSSGSKGADSSGSTSGSTASETSSSSSDSRASGTTGSSSGSGSSSDS